MPTYDVRPVDNDNLHNDDFSGNDLGWFPKSFFGGPMGLNTSQLSTFFLKHLNADEGNEFGATGSGVFKPFLNSDTANNGGPLAGINWGFNTDDKTSDGAFAAANLKMNDSSTKALRLGDIPIIYLDLDPSVAGTEAYYQIGLDINENNANEVSLEELQIFTSAGHGATIGDYRFDDGETLAFRASDGYTLRFNLDATAENNELTLSDVGAGQGKLDYIFYIPVVSFNGAKSSDFVTLFSQFGPTPPDDAGYAEWNTQTAGHITGVKFNDKVADGVRDADGVDNIAGNGDDEGTLGNFVVYIDRNNNNLFDADEQYAITDATTGAFSFDSLLGGTGISYTVREVLSANDINFAGGKFINGANAGQNIPIPVGAWRETTGMADGPNPNVRDIVVAMPTATTVNIAVGNHLDVPNFTITKMAAAADGVANTAGEAINFTIVVKNTGDLALTGVTVTDAVEGRMGTVNVNAFTGDTNGNNQLDTNETWTFTGSYALLQSDLDSKGVNGDGKLTDTASATTVQLGPKTATADVTLTYAPALTIAKTVVSVTNGDGSVDSDGQVDALDDVITYSVVVTNNGNVTLEDILVTDTLKGTLGTIMSLAPGASATAYTYTYSPSQGDLDSNGGGDGLIDNTATASDDEAGMVSDSETVPVDQNPHIDLEKLVSTTGLAGSYIDADTPAAGPQNVAVQSAVFFQVSVKNDGNVSLTDLKITDVNTTSGTPGTTITLYENGMLQLPGSTLTGDGGVLGVLEVGETWTISYTQGFDFGQHVNTAFVTTTQGATDNDAAHYFGIMAGPGVRTPGFWQGANNGALFWDGIQNNSKTGPEFTKNGDLLIYGNTNGTVDSNGDGMVNSSDKGLLIGDYNLNGVTDIDNPMTAANEAEDTLWISFADARQLIDASQKTISGDGVQMLGRDVVATWLNYLAGNGIGNAADTQSPKHFIDDAVDWLQTFGDATKTGVGANTVNPMENFDRYASDHGAVKTNSAFWNTPQGNIDHSASTMHTALDNYNNTGDTFAGGDPYAMNSHSAFDAMLIAASQQIV